MSQIDEARRDWLALYAPGGQTNDSHPMSNDEWASAYGDFLLAEVEACRAERAELVEALRGVVDSASPDGYGVERVHLSPNDIASLRAVLEKLGRTTP